MPEGCIYINELTDYFFLCGSIGRRHYFNELHELFSSVSTTLPKILEEDVKKPETKHDIDLLYIGDINKLADKYSKLVLRKTVDLLVVKKMDKRFYPKVNKYDIFVCPSDNPKHKFFYYMFATFGAKMNIILRNKVKAKGLKLNRRGIFKNNKPINDIKFNYKKNIFYNVKQILKYIYALN